MIAPGIEDRYHKPYAVLYDYTHVSIVSQVFSLHSVLKPPDSTPHPGTSHCTIRYIRSRHEL